MPRAQLLKMWDGEALIVDQGTWINIALQVLLAGFAAAGVFELVRLLRAGVRPGHVRSEHARLQQSVDVR